MPKKEYTNTGASPLFIDGKPYKPGEKFKANLDKESERRLYRQGSIANPKKKKKVKKNG